MKELTAFIQEVTGDSHLRVEEDLGDGFVRLRSAEAERRQAKQDVRCSEDVVIELLRNARDAHAINMYVAISKEGSARKISVIDDGDGIPASMRQRVFDARVTSKFDTMRMDLWGVHGRGMALYAVKTNARVAEVVASKIDGGTAFFVQTDTDELGERRDQSSMPQFIKDDDGVVTVRGPRNINRTVCEFAYIERAICRVHLGSPAEIAATLWRDARGAVSQSVIAFCRNPEELAVCKRLALATTPDEFAEIASGIGIGISSRTARRIMDAEILPLVPIDRMIEPVSEREARNDRKQEALPGMGDPAAGASPSSGRGDVLDDVLFRDTRGLQVSEKDRVAFNEAVSAAYDRLARSYFLDPNVQPEIRYRRDRIDVFIPVIKEE